LRYREIIERILPVGLALLKDKPCLKFLTGRVGTKIVVVEQILKNDKIEQWINQIKKNHWLIE